MTEQSTITTEQVADIRKYLSRQCLQLRSHAVILDRDVMEAAALAGLRVVNPDGSRLQGDAYQGLTLDTEGEATDERQARIALGSLAAFAQKGTVNADERGRVAIYADELAKCLTALYRK